MNNAWEVWSEALTAEECDAIVKRGLKYDPADATVGFADRSRQDQKYRTSVVRWLNASADRDIVDRVMNFVSASNRTNFGFDIVAPYEIQFTEYHGTQGGKYDWHQDVWLESPRPYARKLSVVVQLSNPDEYEGGSFEFFGVQNPGENFCKRGSILVFPSFLEHRVLPVTKGLRRSLVSWVEGPNWR